MKSEVRPVGSFRREHAALVSHALLGRLNVGTITCYGKESQQGIGDAGGSVSETRQELFRDGFPRPRSPNIIALLD